MRESVERRREALERALGRWDRCTLAQRLDRVAALHPDRPFVITETRTWTYAEISEWSRRIAAGLCALGVAPGEHVAMIVANQPEFVALTFGIARAGAVSVPLNYRLRTEELEYVLAQSSSVAVVTMAAFQGFDYLVALDRLAPGWERGGPLAAFPRLRHVVTLPADGTARPRTLDVDALAAGGRPEDAGEVHRRTGDAAGDGIAAVFYTSGTTGFPKGVMLTHDMLLRSAYGSAYTRAFEDGRRILFALPLYHVFAYVEGMLAAMFAGGAIIPQLAFSPAATYEAVARHRATEALFVPTMSIAVVEHEDAAGHDTSSLVSIMSAAAPAPVWLWDRVRERLGVEDIFTGYGMTETAAATTLTMPGDDVQVVADTVGRVKLGGLAGTLCEYRAQDPFSAAPLPGGEEGELAARGAIVTHGYYGKEEDTSAAIDRDGWLRSGDLGRIGDDGYLRLTGRSAELYKCGGELVAPKEVEDVLTRHPAVAQAFVVGVPDERMGEVGVAWVVPVEGRGPAAADLLAYCAEHLARFKVPEDVRFIGAGELPKTTTGKVQKFRLVEAALASERAGG